MAKKPCDRAIDALCTVLHSECGSFVGCWTSSGSAVLQVSVGVSDKALQAAVPDADPAARAAAINALLNAGKIDLFRYEANTVIYFPYTEYYSFLE